MLNKPPPNHTAATGGAGEKTTVLDLAALEELRELAGEQLDVIINKFQEFSAQALIDIEAAAVNEDAKTARDVAHSLKSSSLQLGATALGTLASELEAAGSENDLATMRRIAVQIRATGDETRSAFAQYLETQ